MKQIFWVETNKKFTLRARTDIYGNEPYVDFVTSVTEEDMAKVQQWCEEHSCGRRTSFDTFQFRNKKEITMFLLKWGIIKVGSE